ncbi:hypothetical protein V5740_01635 [Croceibacterium sp. TMG7-5b_MA50]|uniref:hypothetical protein n=1 Tax=Croceibacterium sp. TMG7-5b_MA50 TaxID=3121290 RepID=UPI003222126C
MSAFERAALAQAQDALELAEAVNGAAHAAQDTAAQARAAADSAIAATEQARKAMDAAALQVAAAHAAATGASETAQAAGAAAKSASEIAQAAGATAQSAAESAKVAGASAASATTAARTAETTAQSASKAASQAEQSALQALASTPRLFTGMAAAKLPATVTRIETNGYAEIGTGAATYISDARATAALAAAHPLACFKGEGERYFRLMPGASGAITPEQMGCPSSGNAQPFIQAAINYAHAIRVQRLELPSQRYELWCPIRNPGEHVNTGLSGHYMLVRENIAIVGTGRGKTLLRCLNSLGGTNDTVTQPDIVYGAPLPTGDMMTQQKDWMGSGVNVRPTSSMDFFRLENVEIDGTKTFDRTTSRTPQLNLTHKAVRIQDVNCFRVEMRDVVLRNWGGEIFYTAGSTGIKEELLQNCVLDGSPQCTINSGTCARSTYINVEAGNSYQCEIIGGFGKNFFNCRFYDFTQSVSLMGGAGARWPTGMVGGWPFSYPWRNADRVAPYMNFSGVTVERCNSVHLTSYARGEMTLIDTQLAFGSNAGKLTDIDLRILAIKDSANGPTEPLTLHGPDNLTTPVASSGPAATTMVQPGTNVRIDLTCERSELAKIEGRMWNQAVVVYAKLFDAPNVSVTVHGSGAGRLALLSNTPVSGFVWPRIIAAPDFVPINPNLGAAAFFYINADRNITPWVGANGLEPTVAGTFTIGIDNTGTGYVDGQLVTLLHTGNNGRIIRLPASSGGLRLQQDRYLINKGDRVSLRWDGNLAAWVETGYSTSAALAMKGQAVYDAPSIPAGGSASTTVTVAGAVVGDLVTSVSLGSVGLQGLMVRGEVTANNTVTVWLTNPMTAAIDLPSTTLRVQVAKGFLA